MLAFVVIALIGGAIAFIAAISSGISFLMSLLICSLTVSVLTVFVPALVVLARHASQATTKAVSSGPEQGEVASKVAGEDGSSGEELNEDAIDRKRAAYVSDLEAELAWYVSKYGVSSETSRLFSLSGHDPASSSTEGGVPHRLDIAKGLPNK